MNISKIAYSKSAIFLVSYKKNHLSGSVKDDLIAQARLEDEEQQRKADEEERRLAQQRADEQKAAEQAKTVATKTNKSSAETASQAEKEVSGSVKDTEKSAQDKAEEERKAEEQRRAEEEQRRKEAAKQQRLEARRIREERLKQNADGKVAFSQEDFAYNINLSAERNAMKHKAENRLAELQKGGIQADEKEEANKIKAVLKDIKQHEKASEAQVGFWTKVGSSLPSLPDNVVNFSAGMGDFLSLGFTERFRENHDIGNVDTNSNAYKSGEVTGAVVGAVGLGGTAAGQTIIRSGAYVAGGMTAVSGTVRTASKIEDLVTGEYKQPIYNEQVCNDWREINKYKDNAWVDGHEPLHLGDIGKEKEDFLGKIGVPYERNKIDYTYALMENRSSRAAEKTGLSLGKVTQVPVAVASAVVLDNYTVFSGLYNVAKHKDFTLKGFWKEAKTDLNGTSMGFKMSFSPTVQDFVDNECKAPTPKKKGKK